MGKLRLTPRKEVVFSLGLSQETSSVQIGVEGTNSELIQVEDQTEMAGTEPEGKASQEDPVTPHPVGAKTRPMTKSAMKQGPPTETQASSKRPMKTLGKELSSKRLWKGRC